MTELSGRPPLSLLNRELLTGVFMTDRIHSIILVLAEDIRIDDAESLIAAAKQFRGVIDVTPNVADLGSHGS